jgi:hypothetical protein
LLPEGNKHKYEIIKTEKGYSLVKFIGIVYSKTFITSGAGSTYPSGAPLVLVGFVLLNL